MINRGISEEITTLIEQGNIVKQHIEEDLQLKTNGLEDECVDIEYCTSEFYLTDNKPIDHNSINMKISYKSVEKYCNDLHVRYNFHPDSYVFMSYLVEYLNVNKDKVLSDMANMMFRDAVKKKKEFDAELVKLEMKLKDIAPLVK